MKTKTKAFLAVFLLAIVAISTPVSAFGNETTELYAQASEDESDSSVYDEDDSSEETSADSEESSTESTEEEE